MTKKIVYVDMDNVLVDFRSALPRLKKKVRKEYAGHLDDVPGIFSLMDPMPGALCAFTELALLFDTYILSTSPWDNPSAWSDKLCWVRAHLGEPAYKRLILTHHKELNRGDFLIDDRTRNGADVFEGEHIHFGMEKFPDWPAVMAYLRPRVLRQKPWRDRERSQRRDVSNGGEYFLLCSRHVAAGKRRPISRADLSDPQGSSDENAW